MRIGYAMVDSPLAWMLPLVGVAGLGFATALVGQGLAWLASAPSRGRAALAAGTAVGVALLAGAGALIPVGTQIGSTTVGWVQGGAPGGGV